MRGPTQFPAGAEPGKEGTRGGVPAGDTFRRTCADPVAAIAVEIPAELRRIVAGAIYEAAANLDVKANRARSGTRQRSECAAQAAALRELAEDVAP